MLLIDSLRLNDELAAMASQLPKPEARVSLARPLPGRLRALDGEALDLIQLVLEHGTFARVIDHAPQSDPDAARVLLRLVGLGFVEVRG